MSMEATDTAALGPVAIDEGNLLASVIRLAWPVIVQQVSFSIVQLVDAALVGHLGDDALAGVRLAGQVFWFSQAGMVAVGVGTTAIVARAVGAGKPEEAAKTMRSAMVMALLWGTLMGTLIWLLGNWSLGMMGAEAGAKHQGTVYLKAAAVGMPLLSVVYAGTAALQGAGDTRAPMIIGVFVNVVNIIVAYTLINGAGPVPRMNVLGSGGGFSSAAITGGILVLLVLASKRRAVFWSPWDIGRFDPPEGRRIVDVGLPAGFEQVQFNLAFMIYTRIIASLGTAAVAAHGVTLAIQSLTFNVGFALSVATMALVGQSLGAGRPDLGERSAYITMRYSIMFMSALGVVMMTLGGPITGLFVSGKDADEVISIGTKLLFIFAFSMPAMAISLSLGGGLRGAGDTRAVLYIMAGATWIVRLIPAYIFAIVLGLGVPGAWLAAVLDINVRALLMWLRFRQGRWKHLKV